MNLKIHCVGPGSAEEVEGILKGAFDVISPLLPGIDQQNLGILEIKFPSLNNLSEAINVGPDEHNDDHLWLEMKDDDECWIVDSSIYSHDEGDEGDGSEGDDDEDEDSDASTSDSDISDDSGSSSDSESGISPATALVLAQNTLQMTMLYTAKMSNHFGSNSLALLQMAQMQQAQLTQLVANLDSESETEDPEWERRGD